MKLFNSKTIFLFFLCFNYLSNVFSCAAIQAPSGGPKDETPPLLLHSNPVTGTTNFDQSIYLNCQSNQESFSKNLSRICFGTADSRRLLYRAARRSADTGIFNSSLIVK